MKPTVATRTISARLLPMAALVAALAGCASDALQGRVLEGPASIVTVVAAEDTRLAKPGLAGATIEVRRLNAAPGDAPLAGGTSDEQGAFRLIRQAEPTSEQVVVRVWKDGWAPAEGPIFWPANTRRALVVLRPLGRPVPGP